MILADGADRVASHRRVLLLDPNSKEEVSIAVVATEYVVDDVDGEGGLAVNEAKETIEDEGMVEDTTSVVCIVVETVLGLAVIDLSFPCAVG